MKTILSRKELFFWLNVIDMGGPIPDNFYHYVYYDPGMDYFVRGENFFPEIREFKKLLDILRYK